MKNPYNIAVGEKIHKARVNKKMSMKELGLKVNLHESTISRYEKGDIKSLDIDKLHEFAKVLDVSPEYISGWNEAQISSSKKYFYEIEKLHLSEEKLQELVDYAHFIKNRK
ncbi:helix-turn-helix domain-containing protein [Methanobrevibacter sp.]|uniref:helix-turn-helix domain-containing protein n=1 Tax=Methanobrevibacter sp. TaxID=66852 RepID=UPI00388D9667